MRNYFLISMLFLSFLSCHKKENPVFRSNYSDKEKKIMQKADAVIQSAYYTTLITLDKNNQPRARIVEPFLPDKNFVVWMATNPKSRKVNQLKHNSTTTLHYFDKSKLAYVSLMGNAFLVNDDSIKKRIWKDGWEKFYPNRKKDYLLIQFIPKTLELISITDGFTGDKNTWKPHKVSLQKEN